MVRSNAHGQRPNQSDIEQFGRSEFNEKPMDCGAQLLWAIACQAALCPGLISRNLRTMRTPKKAKLSPIEPPYAEATGFWVIPSTVK